MNTNRQRQAVAGIRDPGFRGLGVARASLLLRGARFRPQGCAPSVYREARTTPFYLMVMAWLTLAASTATADTHYADINSSSPKAPYTSWETAAKSIQDMVDVAGNGDTVLIGKGTYNIREQIVINKGMTVRSVSGRDATTVDANGNCRVFSLTSNKGPIILSGFKITGGNLVNRPSAGGGIHAGGIHPISITDCTVENCKGINGGGGIHVGAGRKGRVLIEIRNCIVRNNEAGHGGGISATMWENASGSITIENCTLHGNRARGQGGGITNMNEDEAKAVSVINCTIAENKAGAYCGGAKCVSIYNSIFYRNTNGDIYDGEGLYQVANSCARNAPPGNGNINSNPRFVNAKLGDFRLLPDSPCIDAGSIQYSTNFTDLAGSPRLVDGNRDGEAVVDMGAYEFQVIAVEIDIKPGSKSNAINLKAGGLLPVAILTTETFDASKVDSSSVRFAGASPTRRALQDVDADGDVDLLLQFQRRGLKLNADSTRVLLTGQTRDKQLFIGTGEITIVVEK